MTDSAQTPVSLRTLLDEMIERGASDLHVAVGERPKLRVDGDIVNSGIEHVLTPRDTLELAYSVLTENQKKRFELEDELDFSFGIANLSRFRGNVFKQRGCVGMVIRCIPFHIKTFNDLNLPPVIAGFADRPRGLVLVTGSTGSGKSTTLAAMIDALPEGCLLALDEAYVELAPDGTAAVVAADDPRVIRFRTFSKAHGMAGLRLGYALAAPDLALAFDKVRNHFGVGRIAQAGGIAALADRGHLDAVRRWAVAGRERLAQIATANGLRPLPSATNFVTMDCGQDGAFARAVMQALIARDIFVRMPGVAPLDRCIRVSLGNDAAYAAFAQALPLALADVTQA